MTRLDQMDRLHMTGHEDDEQDECRAGTATGPGGTMKEWELTDDELRQIAHDTVDMSLLEFHRAIATAAQKKLVEWLTGYCEEHEAPAYVMAVPQPRRECVECVLEISEALGVK